MKFKNLNGGETSIHLIKEKICKNNHNFSNGQNNLRICLENIYNNVSIFEDFIIPKSDGLSLDFYLPNRNIAFEFDGEQHNKFNIFFHKTIDDLVRQKIRDENKDLWCLINGIVIVRITDQKITPEELKPIIRKAILKQKNYS